jgi:hypothetical protein
MEIDSNLANTLLVEFTLKPTADRADCNHDSSSEGWTCTGTLNHASQGSTSVGGGSGGNGGSCAYATNLQTLGSDAIIAAYMVMKKPDVSDKKFLWLLPTDVKKVEYEASTNALAGACNDVDGSFVEKDFTLTCTAGKGSTKEDQASFEVKDYAMCLSPICKGIEKDETVYLTFKDQMLDTNKLPEAKDWTCEGSGAMTTSVQVAVGAVLALLWHLYL